MWIYYKYWNLYLFRHRIVKCSLSINDVTKQMICNTMCKKTMLLWNVNKVSITVSEKSCLQSKAPFYIKIRCNFRYWKALALMRAERILLYNAIFFAFKPTLFLNVIFVFKYWGNDLNEKTQSTHFAVWSMYVWQACFKFMICKLYWIAAWLRASAFSFASLVNSSTLIR